MSANTSANPFCKGTFSIVVPFHNTDIRQTRQCLLSLLGLNGNLIERIVIIDDASSSECKKELKDLINDLAKISNGDKIVVDQLETNVGLAGARKRGFEISSGEYVLFVDSDDYINSTSTLDDLYSLFNTYPEASFIKCGLTRLSGNKETKIPNVDFVPYVVEFNVEGLLNHYRENSGQVISTGLYAFKRESISSTRFWNHAKLPYEDGYFLANMLASGQKAVICPLTHYVYRAANTGSIMWRRRKQTALDNLCVIRDGLTRFSDFNMASNEVCQKLFMIPCLAAVMQSGYSKCAKAVINFPEREQLLAVNAKYGIYTGKASNGLQLMTNDGFGAKLVRGLIKPLIPVIRRAYGKGRGL